MVGPERARRAHGFHGSCAFIAGPLPAVNGGHPIVRATFDARQARRGERGAGSRHVLERRGGDAGFAGVPH
jgi:hypothetical protein